ncbi:chaperonin 10-like protein [Mucidula mucida]|nr:chaperonin 10-like protein [Mucidula mucida]
MSQQLQKSLVIEEKLGPFVVRFNPIPTPAKGEVLVKIIAAGLNPLDWKIQKFGISVGAIGAQYPAVLGLDIAGEVEAIGEDVEGWVKGDKVFCQSYGGAYQQYIIVPAKIVMRFPKNISFDQAVTAPICFVTACNGLMGPSPIGLGLDPTLSLERKYTGHTALIIGGSTCVGQYAIQLLKAIGFTRIIVYASSRHFALLQTFGATDLIDRLQTPITSVPPIVKSLSTDPLTAIYDTIGDAECQQAASDCLSPGGTFVTVMPENVKQDEGKHVIFVAGTLSWPSHKDFGQIIVSKITGWFEEGVIVPNPFEVLPGGLNGVADGLERSFRGEVSGMKLVVHPHETT